MRALLGGIEALEREPAAAGLDGVELDAQAGEGARGVRAERDGAVRCGYQRAALAQVRVQPHAERTGEMVVTGARWRAGGRGGGRRREPVQQREEQLDAAVGELVDRLAALAAGAHEAGVAQAAQVVGELGHRCAELGRERAHRRWPEVAEAVDHPQPQWVRELLEQRHARVAHARNSPSTAASSSGASSAMWWPESIRAPRTSSAQSRQIATGSP